MNYIKVVIGSWGSYNECNDRALGSKWLDLADYEDWEEIETELKEEGFKLDGIDEELFIQDIEGICDNSINWDHMHPKELFETLKEIGVLDDDYKYEEMTAYLAKPQDQLISAVKILSNSLILPKNNVPKKCLIY